MWTSQPLLLVLTGFFWGKFMLFVFDIASGLLIDEHEPCMDTMTGQRLGHIVVGVFIYLFYVQCICENG